MDASKNSKHTINRQTVLPLSLTKPDGHRYDALEKLETSMPPDKEHEKRDTSHKLQKIIEVPSPMADKPALKKTRFPVVPQHKDLTSPLEELWQRYHQLFVSDQAGPGIFAHSNTVDHRLVVIKEHNTQVSSTQRRQLIQTLQDNPVNIVCLLDVFLGPDTVRPVYELLEVSLYQVRATSRHVITEIDLAIIGKEVLQGLQYIHDRLGITYGQLNAKNVLLSLFTCNLKLANIAESVLGSRSTGFADDIRRVGTLLVNIKEPATHARDPDGLQLQNRDVSELCRNFIKITDRASIKQLLEDDFLLKSPGVGRLRIFACRAMEYGSRMRG